MKMRAQHVVIDCVNTMVYMYYYKYTKISNIIFFLMGYTEEKGYSKCFCVTH